MISTTQDLQRETERRAVIDSLTGLYNRRWLDTTLSGQMERCRDTHRDLSVFIMDLDGFKGYNDTYGHLAGDHVLYTVGRTLAGSMRAGEMIARYGGDEFLVLLPDTDRTGARGFVQRVREQLFMNHSAQRIPVNASFGIAASSQHDTVNSMLSAADSDMYRDKRETAQRDVTAVGVPDISIDLTIPPE